jgi:hypothetical protein
LQYFEDTATTSDLMLPKKDITYFDKKREREKYETTHIEEATSILQKIHEDERNRRLIKRQLRLEKRMEKMKRQEVREKNKEEREKKEIEEKRLAIQNAIAKAKIEKFNEQEKLRSIRKASKHPLYMQIEDRVES